MQLIDGTFVYSASDLVAASECPFEVARRVDALLGHGLDRDLPGDALLDRAAELGDAHEARLVDQYRTELGDHAVQEIGKPTAWTLDALRAGQHQTLEAVNRGVPVITQAVLFDGQLLGFADFLIRGDDGAYEVADAKLARHAKVRAVLQIAAYHDLANAAGIPVADSGRLLLGDLSQTTHHLPHVVPVVRERRRRLDALIIARQGADQPLAWGDDSVSACGRCGLCQAEAEDARDVLLVAGLRMTQRAKLRAAGITTIDALAASSGPVPGIPTATLANLRAQAVMQRQQMAPPGAQAPAAAPEAQADHAPVPSVTWGWRDAVALASLPAPSSGDIFFDFEGDPLWQDEQGRYGLEYLFGIVEAPDSNAPADAKPVFRSFVAHSRDQERVALLAFLDYVAQRRTKWPNMHIYHYADYERAALKRLVGLHGVGEDQVDDLLRAGALVDLYKYVGKAIRVSQPSYSLKKLESLFMGDDLRTSDVTTAADSVVAYATYCQARESGDQAVAQQILDEITDYNDYDCRATLRLRDWLVQAATAAGIQIGTPATKQEKQPSARAAEEAAIVDPLLAWAQPAPGQVRSPDQQAVALVAAAVGYHRREEKPYWWEHFARIEPPLDSFEGDRDAMAIADVEVLTDWHKLPSGLGNDRRILQLRGQLPTGSQLQRADKSVNLLYDPPHPEALTITGAKAGARGLRSAAIDATATHTDPDGLTTLRVTEVLPKNADRYFILPIAVAPTEPPKAKNINDALRDLAGQLTFRLEGVSPGAADSAAALPTPVRDLLLRRPPTLTSGAPLPAVPSEGFTTPILAAVLSLDGSALAVQGPPGTGKTHVGSHVIAALVLEHKWRIGVVSQGHAAVDHMLDQIVAAGVPAEQVGKKKRPDAAVWTSVDEAGYHKFLSDHQQTGCVLGGTVWDFTNTKRVSRGELDLLVIDEAGQFSLAHTLAASVSAQRLLLLGDPQQLPQVSQGTHPEPVDTSALGWLSEGHTLDTQHGYFLDQTWRMHPDLTARVSDHSYDARLTARVPHTTNRSLHDGDDNRVTPGLWEAIVEHHGNSVESIEEAQHVVGLAQQALTWTWQDHPDQPPRPLGQADILVVAPYNAQVALIRRQLANAGLAGIPVGTVDKFQGQQAPLVIVSMTASALEDISRGMGFLISPNRVNVAISRAKWRATIVRSEALTDYVPTTPEQLVDLGRFLGLSSISARES